ncbi:MAG: single-stranded-DNA-specific exonuclease RecJ [bacterium]
MTLAPRSRWRWPDIEAARVDRLVAALGLTRPTATLLLARGLDSSAKLTAFLRPAIGGSGSANTFLGGPAAVERLVRAIREDEGILIHGDYDVDGICGGVLYKRGLTLLGARTRLFLPSRFKDGYGVANRAVERAVADGSKVLLTSDTGSQAYEAIDLANQHGIDVVVTDHHQLGLKNPDTPYFINPQQPDCPYPFKGLSGGGIALKVLQAVAAELGSALPLDEYLPLAALSTIADVCPLQEENRALVTAGLELLERTRHPGLRALVATLPREMGTRISARDCSHGLIPKLNAAGRLDSPRLAAELLLCDDASRAKTLAAELEELNRERKQIREAVGDQAIRQADALLGLRSDRAALVLANPHWHFGVVGIVAARIGERYGRPAILLSQHQEQQRKGPDGGPWHYTGSGRAPAGFPLLEALEQCRPYLLHFGGHATAVGLALETGQLEQFRGALEDAMAAIAPTPPSLALDGLLAPSELTLRLIRELQQLEPTGAGNPEPLFAFGPIEITEVQSLGDGSHRRLHGVGPDGKAIQAVHFGCPSAPPPKETPLAIVGTPVRSVWKGVERLEIQVKDIGLWSEVPVALEEAEASCPSTP